MTDKLLIVFVKNILLGKVKTRLAKTIGNQNAFSVYKRLVEITENETNKIEECDIHIFFSDEIIDDKWQGKKKFVQSGADLGERMMNAFIHGFESGYTTIVGVGSDLPDLDAHIISNAFKALEQVDTVWGPAEDGGYYLIGMNKLQSCVFTNKEWSTDTLLLETFKDLDKNKISKKTLQTLNDVDTLEDLKSSKIASEFNHLFH